MRRPFAAAALAVTALLACAAARPAATAPPAAQPATAAKPATATLPDSVPPFAAARAVSGSVPGSSPLTIQFWLAPRTAAAAERYATASATPGSPLFRHFLSPAGYTARFGATAAAAAAVESWLKSAGFAGVTADPGRDYVQATAPAATIESALRVGLRYYRAGGGVSAGPYRLRANDRPVSLPAAVAGSVLGVTGLDNAAPVMTYAKAGATSVAGPVRAGAPGGEPPRFPCSRWYWQHYATGLPPVSGATRFPTIGCGYTPRQLRRAYGYSAANSGRGVTVALVEVGLAPGMLATLRDYARAGGIQAPSARRYAELPLGRGSACGDPFNVEEQLDVEASYLMAPLASQLVVGGDSCDNGFSGLQALYDADLAILNGSGGHPLARIASNSWEGDDETIPANMLRIEHAYLVRAAAEGVTMLFSAGDISGVEDPASDPYATAVGGTTLAVGHDNPRLFETGWSTGISCADGGSWHFQGEQGASGGGASLLWRQPGYQRGVVPDALATANGDRGGLARAVPDLSAVADPFTGMAVGMLSFSSAGQVTGYFEQSVGGTSLATPLVAGIVADAEQGQRWFGFLNPALYRLARVAGVFHDARPLAGQAPARYRGVACDRDMCGELSLATFDDQRWSMAGYTGQVTAAGYDTMTGIGTPDGQRFIAALRRL